ncbi:hypothetical protein [Clostridium felsineum]|uniref:hypothetical protein n=1 Tax=Clostridium felsineum TaxID=36839 RepID=UPI00098C33A5|nr:hypothetical protein [Clostridium felsineum]URZ01704.1 hypothetical protein CLAUR_016990 [Clostridium felsineum]
MNSKKNNSINALIVYNYLGYYTEFEDLIKEKFISNFEKLSEEYKNRTYFYIGGIGCSNSYLEYDTYSLIRESTKYDKRKLLNRLTMNQIIKLERKEQAIDMFKKNIYSIQIPKIYFTFCDCCIKLINARNIMAHEFFNLNLKEKDIIEVLSKEKIEQFKPEWLGDFEYNELSDGMLGILSNYIYMKELKKVLNES